MLIFLFIRLIVGLGNPGKKFEKTRHSVGYMLGDYLVEKMGGNCAEYRLEKKFEAEVLRMKDYLFVKPQTYMNSSGRSVRKILDFYKLDAEKDLILCHDDLDIELGKFKIQKGKGPRVHNGINSVIDNVGLGSFWRVRIGIVGEYYDMVKKQGGTMKNDYVLKDFGFKEKLILEEVFRLINIKLIDLKLI